IVGADFQANEAIDVVTSRCQHQDGNSRSSPDSPQHIEAVCTRQHHVEHYQVVFVRKRAVHASLAVVNSFNRVTLRLQILADQLAKSDVVVDHKYTFHRSLGEI